MKWSSSSLLLLIAGILMVSLAITAGCTQPGMNSLNPNPAQVTTVTPVSLPQGTLQATPAHNSGTGSCKSGYTDCNGFCRDLTLDIGNCGGCGNTCPDNSACTGGQCMCKGSYSACGDTCRDLTADAKNCGTCGMICPSGQVCLKGQCGVTCTGGKTGCGNTCADLTSDPANCGSCGIACPAGQVCNNGQCGVSCINNLKYCNGFCRDLTSDVSNCGACGVICPSGQSCQNGQCGQSCGSGLTLCNGVCRNLLADSSNCGVCGNQCPAASTCNTGVCTAAAPTVSWAGSWNTGQYGTLVMIQSGNSVSGVYGVAQNTLSGTTSNGGFVLTGTWKEGASTGTFEFDMANNQNQFTGWYAVGALPIDKTKNFWNGSR